MARSTAISTPRFVTICGPSTRLAKLVPLSLNSYQATPYVAGRSPLGYTVVHIYCETVEMKNITVSIDEETHRHARIRAAELGTSVSALVRGYLRELVAEPVDVTRTRVRDSETEGQRRRRLLKEVIADFDARGVGLRMDENLPREALYDRDALR